MTDYKYYTAINKLYRNWVNNNKEHPRGRGKPPAIEVPEIVSTSKDMLKNRSHDSSTVKILHMKEVIASKKKSQAAEDGLDPDSVECKVSTRNAKVKMVVAAATSDLSFQRRSYSSRLRLVFAQNIR